MNKLRRNIHFWTHWVYCSQERGAADDRTPSSLCHHTDSNWLEQEWQNSEGRQAVVFKHNIHTKHLLSSRCLSVSTAGLYITSQPCSEWGQLNEDWPGVRSFYGTGGKELYWPVYNHPIWIDKPSRQCRLEMLNHKSTRAALILIKL